MSSRLIARIRPPRDEFRPAALTLRDVTSHPDGAAALQELGATYVISEIAGGLLFTQQDADLRLYLYDLPGILGAARRNAERREQEARRTGKRYGPEDLAWAQPTSSRPGTPFFGSKRMSRSYWPRAGTSSINASTGRAGRCAPRLF